MAKEHACHQKTRERAVHLAFGCGRSSDDLAGADELPVVRNRHLVTKRKFVCHKRHLLHMLGRLSEARLSTLGVPMKRARRKEEVLAADAVIGTALGPVRQLWTAVEEPARCSIRHIRF